MTSGIPRSHLVSGFEGFLARLVQRNIELRRKQIRSNDHRTESYKMLKIMLANIIPNQLRKLVLLSAGMLALFALTACGGNDTAVDVQPTQIPTLTIAPVSDVATPVVIAQQPSVTPTVVPVPTTTATPQPSATPLVVTESASPEEIKIIDTHVDLIAVRCGMVKPLG